MNAPGWLTLAAVVIAILAMGCAPASQASSIARSLASPRSLLNAGSTTSRTKMSRALATTAS